MPSTMSTILQAARRIEVCDLYQSLQIASNNNSESDFLDNGITLIEYAYSAGIITEALINTFDQGLLNSKGIYNTEGPALVDPDRDVYIFGNADVNITLNDQSRRGIFLFSPDAVVTVTCNDSSHADIKIKDGLDFTLITNGNSTACVETKKDGNASNITVNDSSTVHLSTYLDAVTAIVTGATDAYVNLKAFHNSVTTGDTSAGGEIEVQLNQEATYA